MRTIRLSYLHRVVAGAAIVLALVAAPAFASSKYAGIYSSEAPDSGEPNGPAGPAFSISLGPDGSATVTQDLGKGAVTTFGHWSDAGGQVTIKFDEVEGKPTESTDGPSAQPRWTAGGYLEPHLLGKNDSSSAQEGRVELARQQEARLPLSCCAGSRRRSNQLAHPDSNYFALPSGLVPSSQTGPRTSWDIFSQSCPR